MSFTVHLNPDHVQFTIAGVFCVNCGEFTPGQQEWCIGTAADGENFSGCASSALAYVEAGEWMGELPNPGHPHRVEHDLSSGMIGYTRLSREEIKELAADAKVEEARQKELLEIFQARELKKAAAREVLKLKAKDDPLWAAMADLFNVESGE